jgi:hypothetical protein
MIGQPVPDGFDLLACFIQSATAIYLTGTLLRADAATRPMYQILGLVRPILTTLAFGTGDTLLHRASIKLLGGFVYMRLMIYCAGFLEMQKVHTPSTIYAYSFFLAGILAVYEAALPAGILVSISLTGSFILISWYTAEPLRKQRSVYDPK